MKIIAVLETEISVGGGFNQALNAILQMQRICQGKFEFEVFTTKAENINYLKSLDIKAIHFSFSILDKLLSILGFSRWWQLIQCHLKILGGFEKKLIKLNCHLVYFVTPSDKSCVLQCLNFISTVWDLCHRDMPEFPEVRNFNQIQLRDLHNNNLVSSLLILVDSEVTYHSISRIYGIDHYRVLTMPFSPSPFLSLKSMNDKSKILIKYNLIEGYFFYPAQFWAHKNHIRLLEALLILRDKGIHLSVVFAGGDQGNRRHIEQFVNHHELGNQVHFLGFVPTEDMRGLYEGSKAVVIPSYFGPTNLPPLEAWLLEKPLICSNQCAKFVGDAAICFNPDDAHELAESFQSCDDQNLCDRLIERGKEKLASIEKQRKNSETSLLARLEQFEKRQRCWP